MRIALARRVVALDGERGRLGLEVDDRVSRLCRHDKRVARALFTLPRFGAPRFLHAGRRRVGSLKPLEHRQLSIDAVT